MKWFEDPPSQNFRNKVLDAAETELAKLRPVKSRRFFVLRLATGFAAAAAGVMLWNRNKSSEPTPAVASANVDPALLKELPMIQSLDLFEHLEMFETWNELDKDV